MANDVQILDKIQRNCEQAGLTVSRTDADTLVAEGMTITYSAAVIQSPMGGVSDAASPFLGIGIANPGKLELDTIPATLVRFRVLRIMCGHSNSINVAGLGELEGHVDLLGMGQ
jgi:hypothetical protein